MLTEALVTRPANSSVMPNARMIGQAVGAGSVIVPGAASVASAREFRRIHVTLLPSATDDVNHREHNDPDRINKMPIQRKDFDALAVLRFHFA